MTEEAKKVYPIAKAVASSLYADNHMQIIMRAEGVVEVYNNGPFRGSVADLDKMIAALTEMKAEHEAAKAPEPEVKKAAKTKKSK